MVFEITEFPFKIGRVAYVLFYQEKEKTQKVDKSCSWFSKPETFK